MTFLRHESSSLTRSRSQRPISLFCIDLRDGAQVKGPHRVPTTYMGAIGIAGDPKEQEVTITLSGQRVIMKFTDKDRVPAPPRQDFADGVATPVARSSDPFGNRFFAPQFQR